MNTGLAVLASLVLIAVVLLVVWLVLRSRSTTESVPTAAASAADRLAGAPGPDSSASAVPVGVGAATAADPAGPDLVEETGAQALVSAGADPSEGADLAEGAEGAEGADLAEEYVGPGLSGLGDAGDLGDTDAGDAGEAPTEVAGTDGHETSADDEISAAPPRTPAEAFGSAAASGDVDAHEAARRETSVLDDSDVDSTPLFRSIREERLGVASPAATTETGSAEAGSAGTGSAEAGWADDGPGGHDGEVRADPHIDPSGVLDADASGMAHESPTAEEDQQVNTDQATPVAEQEAAAPTDGDQPPPLRISELREVVDGGFGIGSAAPIADGAQPLGHPIKANGDTKTYQDLRSPWYDSTEPDVWFLDAGFAERAGFHRAE